MKKTYKLIALLLGLALMLALAACGGAPAGNTARPEQQTETPEPAQPAEGQQNTAEAGEPEPDAQPEPAGREVLVVYFSATGTTRGVAEKLAAVTDADLYEILASQPYTEADLNWHDSGSRTTLEQNDKSVRPEIGSEELSLEGYTTVYVGFPIWWGEEPRILDTFAESHDFTGLTVIPFCTSGSSGIGRSGRNLEENAGSGTWLEGRRFSAGVTEEELRTWTEGLR